MITESQTIYTDRISVRKKSHSQSRISVRKKSHSQSVTIDDQSLFLWCYLKSSVTWRAGCRLLTCSFYRPQLDVKEAKIVKDHPQWDISDDEADKANNEDESEEEEDSDYSSEEDGSD